MKKTKKNDIQVIPNNELGMNYLKSLENDPKYQIEVDPQNFYEMSDEQKKFIKLFVEYRNLNIVAGLMDIDTSDAKEYFMQYSTQQEIRRINAALYHRQVATNIIAFEDIGAYLSSWLIGSDITEIDKLKPNEKLAVVKLLMEWHKLMKDFTAKPELITTNVIEEELKTLSVANIKQLIHTNSMLNQAKSKKDNINNINVKQNKQDIIDQLNVDSVLSKDELAYLENLSVKELLEVLKDE